MERITLSLDKSLLKKVATARNKSMSELVQDLLVRESQSLIEWGVSELPDIDQFRGILSPSNLSSKQRLQQIRLNSRDAQDIS